MKETLGSLEGPLVLEPRGLYRTDGKRPDSVTKMFWDKIQYPERQWITFQPVAIEVQGYSGESSEFSITRHCTMLCLARETTKWPILEAMDLSGSSDRQCGRC